MNWATETYELAAAASDAVARANAAVVINNLLEVGGQIAAAAEADADHGRQFIMAGGPAAGRFMLTRAGIFSLGQGKWHQAEDYLRPALASGDGGNHEAIAQWSRGLEP